MRRRRWSIVVEMFSAPPPISEKQEYGKMEIVVERNSGIYGSKRGWGFSKSKARGSKTPSLGTHLVERFVKFAKVTVRYLKLSSKYERAIVNSIQGEPSFHFFGFVMCISATAARAFKSVLQGILLSSGGCGMQLQLILNCWSF